MAPNGDDGIPATKGDVRRIYDQLEELPGKIDEKIEKMEKRVDEKEKTRLRIHSAECPARDVHNIQQQVLEGKLAPLVRDHPIAVIGGSGLVGVAAGIALKIMGVM